MLSQLILADYRYNWNFGVEIWNLTDNKSRSYKDKKSTNIIDYE